MALKAIVDDINADLAKARVALLAAEVKAKADMEALPAEWKKLVQLEETKSWQGYVGMFIVGMIAGVGIAVGLRLRG